MTRVLFDFTGLYLGISLSFTNFKPSISVVPSFTGFSVVGPSLNGGSKRNFSKTRKKKTKRNKTKWKNADDWRHFDFPFSGGHRKSQLNAPPLKKKRSRGFCFFFLDRISCYFFGFLFISFLSVQSSDANRFFSRMIR